MGRRRRDEGKAAPIEKGESLWRDAMRRLRKNRLAVGSAWVVLVIAALGYASPLLSRHVTHFSLDEQHTNLVYQPPGVQDISFDHPTYDGDKAAFDRIDTDHDGVIACTLEPLATFSIPSLRLFDDFLLEGRTTPSGEPLTVYQVLEQRVLEETEGRGIPFRDIVRDELGTIHCPEIDRLNKAFRFYDFLFADYDVVAHGGAVTERERLAKQPDDYISIHEFPASADELPAKYRKLGVEVGEAAFGELDANGDGYLTRAEVIEGTRTMRFDKVLLLREHDRNRDLRITRDEFPGAPELHTFWLGTDSKGRDLLTRLLYGARISITIGLLATLVSFFIGVTYGAVAAYLGGRVDNVMMRFVDVLYGLPFMFVVIVLIVTVGRSTVNLFIALGAVQWLTMSRVVRGQVMSLKTREFVEAARATGVSSSKIIFRHLLRNTVGPVIVYSTLMVPAVIKEEAFLSFLGLGVQPPDPSWGNLIADGARKIQDYHWLIVYPGLALAVTLFCMNFLGDGLRDALDPQAQKD